MWFLAMAFIGQPRQVHNTAFDWFFLASVLELTNPGVQYMFTAR
jgi:hypothetical protein